MVRMFLAVLIWIFVCGCGAAPEEPSPETMPKEPAEQTGSTSQALSAAIDFTVSTRSPSVVDDSTVTVTAPSSAGLPGSVSDANASVCWIQSINGSFRGLNEYVRLNTNGSGIYTANARSNTSYDSATGVGPYMSIRCRRMTDFMPIAVVPNFSTTLGFVTVDANGGSGSTRVATVLMDWTSLWPWSGGGGRLGTAGGITYNHSVANRSTVRLEVSIARDCPLGLLTYCSMSAFSYQTASASNTWTYSVNSTVATNSQDVALVSASSNECFIDGILGDWRSNSSALVWVSANDGKWHLQTTQGSSTTGIKAYASCIPYSQGF